MSDRDILRSFAEARTDDEECLPEGAVTYGAIRKALAEIESLSAQLRQSEIGEFQEHERAEKAEQDARRYRFFRDPLSGFCGIRSSNLNGRSGLSYRYLDEAIDAAIGKPLPAGEEPSSQK